MTEMESVTIDMPRAMREFIEKIAEEKYDGCPACFITYLIRIYQEEFER